MLALSDTMQINEEPRQLATLADIKLPPSFRITAKQISDASHSRRVTKRRERRLRRASGKEARDALGAVSDAAKERHASVTLETLNKEQITQREARSALRQFENSPSRIHDQRTVELRTSRAYDKFTAAERQFVRRHALDQHGKLKISEACMFWLLSWD